MLSRTRMVSADMHVLCRLVTGIVRDRVRERRTEGQTTQTRNASSHGLCPRGGIEMYSEWEVNG